MLVQLPPDEIAAPSLLGPPLRSEIPEGCCSFQQWKKRSLLVSGVMGIPGVTQSSRQSRMLQNRICLAQQFAADHPRAISPVFQSLATKWLLSRIASASGWAPVRAWYSILKVLGSKPSTSPRKGPATAQTVSAKLNAKAPMNCLVVFSAPCSRREANDSHVAGSILRKVS